MCETKTEIDDTSDFWQNSTHFSLYIKALSVWKKCRILELYTSCTRAYLTKVVLVICMSEINLSIGNDILQPFIGCSDLEIN